MALKLLLSFRTVQSTKRPIFISVVNFSKIPFPIVRPFLHLYVLPLNLYKSYLHILETVPQFPLFLEILLNTADVSIVFISYLSKRSYATKASTFLPRVVNVVQSVWLFFTEAFWLIFSLSLSFFNWLPNVGK